MNIGPILRLLARLRPIGERIGGLAVVLAALAQLIETIVRLRDARNRAREDDPSYPGEEVFHPDGFEI